MTAAGGGRLLLAVALLLAGCGGGRQVSFDGALAPAGGMVPPGATPPVRIAVALGGKDLARQYARCEPLAGYLRARLKRPVTMVYVRDSARLGGLFAGGQAEFGLLNMSARQRLAPDSAATVALLVPATPRRALLVVRRDSLLRRFTDLRGKTVALAAPDDGDAAAYALQRARAAGDGVAAHFFAVRPVADFAGACRMVQEGRCDAACVGSDYMPEVPAGLKVIDSSDALTGDIVVAGTAALPSLTAALVAALQAMATDPAARDCRTALHDAQAVTAGMTATAAWRTTELLVAARDRRDTHALP